MIWSARYSGLGNGPDTPVGVVLHAFQVTSGLARPKAYVAGTTTWPLPGDTRYVLLGYREDPLASRDPITDAPMFYPPDLTPAPDRAYTATAMCKVDRTATTTASEGSGPHEVYITGYSQPLVPGPGSTHADWATVKFNNGQLDGAWTDVPANPMDWCRQPAMGCEVPSGVYDGAAHGDDYARTIYAAMTPGHPGTPPLTFVWVAGTSQVDATTHQAVMLQYSDNPFTPVCGKDWKAFVSSNPSVPGLDAVLPVAMVGSQASWSGSVPENTGDVVLSMRVKNAAGNYDWRLLKWDSRLPDTNPATISQLCESAIYRKLDPLWSIDYPLSGPSGNDVPFGLTRYKESQIGSPGTTVHSIFVTGSVFNFGNPSAGVDTGLVKYQESYP
ncbi:MAG: hypothetical protein JNM80_11085 [Phycisphaerae bacterium]|nr:hypothetical protein [Phycisphaerae bacterium]